MRRIIFVVALSLLWPAVLIKSRGNNGLVFSSLENAQSTKLNPYVDITTYGARAVTSVPSTTATCSSGSATVSLASASSFQNGDGIRLDGCGATNSMRTPSAPNITPKIASGLIGTEETVNSPSGSTTYNYQCVAADKQGAYTAASAIGSITTGLARLGDSGAIPISSISRSGNIITVSTSSATNIVAGASVWILGVRDGSFNGAFKVASAPNRNQFTYASGVTTANGGSTSANGGTVDYYLANEVVCPAISGAVWKYYVYLNGSLIGQTKPLENIYDDWGATLRGTPSFPAYIPASAPTSAVNDPLVTTIVSGVGSTTLLLANKASSSVSLTRAIFDNGPTIAAAVSAAAGSPVFIPNTSSGSFVINSYLSLGGPTIWQAGSLTLNDTLSVGSGLTWIGYLGGSSKNGPSGGMGPQPTTNIGPAYPGVYIFGNSTLIDGVLFSNAADQALDVLDDGGGTFGGTYSHLMFVTGNGGIGEDYLGIAYEVRGKFGIKFENTTVTPNMNNSGPMGLWAPSIFLRGATTCCSVASQITFNTTSLYSKGLGYEATWGNSTMSFFIDWWYTQGPRMPMVSLSQSFVGGLGGQASIKNTTIDTSFAPTLANFASGAPPTIYLENVAGPSGSQLNVTGNPLSIIANANVTLNGINSGVTNLLPANFTDQGVAVVGSGNFTSNFSARPAAPTVEGPTAGGNVPVGSHTYSIQYLDINGGTSAVGAGATVNITSGHQTVRITPVNPPAGAIQYFPLRDGVRTAVANTGQGNCGNPGQNPPPHGVPVSQSFVDSFGFTCGNSTFVSNAAGPTSLGSKGLSTPSLNLINNGFTATPVFPGKLTANRSVALPDGSSATVLAASLTTTSASSDKIIIQGVTSSSHCWPAATNASAAANISTIYISAVEKNQVTVTHKAISGMTFTIACTPD